jgi:hypothetical protein
MPQKKHCCRPPVPRAIAAIARELAISGGLSQRQIVMQLKKRSISISLATIQRILAGTRLCDSLPEDAELPLPRPDELRAGESWCAPPQRCPDCGALILIEPCRTCRVRRLAMRGI